MTEMLTRPLFDNRMLRAAGGPDLSVSLGTSMRAVFDTPTTTGLISTFAERRGAEISAFTDEQFQTQMEIQTLIDEAIADWQLMPPGEVRDGIYDNITSMRESRDVMVAAQSQMAIDAGRMRAPDDLADQYGDLGLEFDRPMSQEEADFLVDGKKAEIIRNALISAGPRGVLATAAKFSAGLAAMAVDPLELASTVIPIVGQAGKAAAIARFGRVGGRVAVGTTEGFAGNLLFEPAYYALSRQQQLDYTMNDALLNIGLGAVFGAGIGTVAGVAARATPDGRVDLPPGVTPSREAADIVIRQFVTDQPIDVARILAGRDLRATTALSRAGPVEFPGARAGDVFRPSPDAAPPRPTYVAVDTSGVVRTFPTAQKADVFAVKVGGEVLSSSDGFVVRQPAEGDFIRRADDSPRTFQTEREASKFVSSQRDIAPDAKVVPFNADSGARFAVVTGMSDSDIRAITSASGTVDVPQRVDTMSASQVDPRVAAAARQVAAQDVEYYARQSTGDAAQDAADLRASDEVAQELSGADERVAQETADEILEDTADLDLMVKQIDEIEGLSPEERASLDEVKAMESHANDYSEVAEAAAICMGRA